jgi:hypothetical protein
MDDSIETLNSKLVMTDISQKRTESDLKEAEKKLRELDEVRAMKALGDGSILKAISDTIINRWEHDYKPKYMEASEVKLLTLDLAKKCSQNFQMVESVTEACEKLNTSCVKLNQYTID